MFTSKFHSRKVLLQSLAQITIAPQIPRRKVASHQDVTACGRIHKSWMLRWTILVISLHALSPIMFGYWHTLSFSCGWMLGWMAEWGGARSVSLSYSSNLSLLLGSSFLQLLLEWTLLLVWVKALLTAYTWLQCLLDWHWCGILLIVLAIVRFLHRRSNIIHRP